jgi:hypothetical protein
VAFLPQSFEVGREHGVFGKTGWETAKHRDGRQLRLRPWKMSEKEKVDNY